MDVENIRSGNAAGTAKHMGDVKTLCRSGVSRGTIGSATLEERPGNIEDPRTYYYDKGSGNSVNAIGLKNMGMTAYEKVLPEMDARLREAGKELAFSIAGFSPKEFGELAERSAEAGVRILEINLGCPNIHTGTGRKPIFSYDPALTEEVLAEVKSKIGTRSGIRAIAKISPVEDEVILVPLINVINRSEIVDEVVGCNTLPDQRMKTVEGEEALSFRAAADGPLLHIGGGAGEMLRKKSLHVVKTLRGLLLPQIDITIVGGIQRGTHVLDGVREGASGFACATAYFEQGPNIFRSIFEEIAEAA